MKDETLRIIHKNGKFRAIKSYASFKLHIVGGWKVIAVIVGERLSCEVK